MLGGGLLISHGIELKAFPPPAKNRRIVSGMTLVQRPTLARP